MITAGIAGHTGRHVSNTVTALILRHARSVDGDAGIAEVLRLAGETRTIEELEDAANWSSGDQALTLFDALAEYTADPDVGLLVGEDLLRQYEGTEIAALLRSLGSPSELLRNIAATSAKYSTMVHSVALEIGDTEGTIEYKSAEGFTRSRHMCNYSKGALTQVSPLFGFGTARVEELQCQATGADSCLYRVRWDTVPVDDAQQRLVALQGELAAMTTRFEQLQETATELVSAGGVDEALDAITRRAGLAVRAPQFLLAVRLGPQEPLRVHSIGFTAEEATTFAAELLQGEVDDNGGSRLVVAIGAGEDRYGQLAAVLPDNATFFAHERRLLEAYAAHAAAALHTAAALELSQRRDRTARALLELAKSLARVTTEDEACARAATAVVASVDCDRSRVWLLEGDTLRLAAMEGVGAAAVLGRLSGQAFHDTSGDPLDAIRVSVEDSPFTAGMIRDPRPLFVARGTAEPEMRSLLDLTDDVATAMVPICSQDGFIGIVAAAVVHDAERLRRDDDLVERLSGIADHAAIAITNARLVEQIRHQALHDGLTGLPNTRLLEDRVEQALHAAAREGTQGALLFVDLDRFKSVNDSLGHQKGDELLKQAAARLLAGVRAADTVARVGGDEFCLLLRNVSDADSALAVAAKIAAAMCLPFDLGPDRVTIGASVGVAVFPEDGTTFQDLLKHSDSAMYRAKTAGRSAR